MRVPVARASGEFTVERIAWSGSGHWGSPAYHVDDATSGSVGGVSPEGLLGRNLGPGTRVRVTVEVLEEHDLDPTKGAHHRDPSGMCALCVKDRPDLFVVLACGHGRRLAAWERDERPTSMACWDGWCASRCGEQEVVRHP